MISLTNIDTSSSVSTSIEKINFFLSSVKIFLFCLQFTATKVFREDFASQIYILSHIYRFCITLTELYEILDSDSCLQIFFSIYSFFKLLENVQYIIIDEVLMMCHDFYKLFILIKRVFPKFYLLSAVTLQSYIF